VVPSPFDPNLSTGFTQASITFSLTGSGSITGVLCTNNGAPLSNPANITLTISGAGSQATIVPVVMQTITGASVTGAGTGYGTVAVLITSVGGNPSAGTVTNNPDYLNLAWRPRPAQISATINGTGTLSVQAGSIIDGGLFENKPTPVIVPSIESTSISGATITFTMGSVSDIAVIQQAP
jgi:hypothetical protein